MKYFLGSVFIFFVIVSTGTAFATGSELNDDNTGSELNDDNAITIDNPIKSDTVQALFTDIIGIVLVFAIPIIVFFIIFAGFKYVTAQGNSEAISEANRMLLYALIGGLLILGANVLIEVVQGTVDSIKSD